jgi:hypothetical protein
MLSLGWLLLRPFGIRPDPDPEWSGDMHECPTCGHRRPTNGIYRQGRLVATDDWLRSEYEGGQLDTDSYIEQMETRP